MKRGAGADIFLRTLDRVRSKVPGITLRTSFIVGFPGETDEDFAILSQLRRASPDSIGWAFSAIPTKRAPPRTRSTRKFPMRTRRSPRTAPDGTAAAISRRRKPQLVGTTVELLVEGESDETPLLWEGRTAMHAPEIDGKVFVNDFGPHDTLSPAVLFLRNYRNPDHDLVVRILD